MSQAHRNHTIPLTEFGRDLMGEQIFVQDREGQLDSLEEERFATEEELQELLATRPELLDGVQINPDAPRRWMVIGREQGIAQAAGEGDWWSVDHLLVDQDAIPTLVEVKRGSNPEIRRTVVGQLLEYAAHARLSWSADGMRRPSKTPRRHCSSARRKSSVAFCSPTASRMPMPSGGWWPPTLTRSGCACSSSRTTFPLR